MILEIKAAEMETTHKEEARAASNEVALSGPVMDEWDPWNPPYPPCRPSPDLDLKSHARLVREVG